MRKIPPELRAILTQHDRYLIVGHRDPDGDAIGSVLALAAVLTRAGKDVYAGLPDAVPSRYRFLPRSDTLTTAAPDDSFPVGVALDCAQLSRAEQFVPALEASQRLINIDHHQDNSLFGTVNLVDSTAAATALILYDLLETLGSEIDADVATCLYCAIGTDTGFFRFANTSARALEVCAELVRAGADPRAIATRAYLARPPGHYRLLGRALSSMSLELGGRVAYAQLSAHDFESAGVGPDETEGIIDHLKTVEGTQVAVLLRDDGAGRVKGSLRSPGALDVGSIARSFGGGGHAAAAGFELEADLDAARSRTLSAVAAALADQMPGGD